jgi:malate dehydrogenase (oxaloacetate-decarboxylating)
MGEHTTTGGFGDDPPRPLRAPAETVRTDLRGKDLIGNPLLNKGTAFSDDERHAFGLLGLLPPHSTTIEEQVALELEHVRRKPDDLEKYIGLAATQDRNETLFYRLLCEHMEEFLPIVYTPTVGRACQEFSHIFRRPRGVWITPDDVERVDEILRAATSEDVRLIVVTDNERILGLGDQGCGGMLIPVGKLSLYTAAAGIHPSWTLPVSLDVGTDRRELRDDPLYLGYRAPRLRGAAYDEVVEAFVKAVRRVFPRALLQWEDFKQHNALRILDRYRDRLPSFNDDVQGTAAVVLAGLLAARRERGGLAGERILSLGAGAAAIGISALVVRQLVSEGLDQREAHERILLMDSKGVLHTNRESLDDNHRPFALDAARLGALGMQSTDLRDPAAVARAFGPTVLLGTTGHPGAFTRELVRVMADADPPPVIMPLSNPSDRAEATPVQLMEWTDGRAIVATGSPFPEVLTSAGTRVVGQANNVFIFPGVGLGAALAEARRLPEEAFLVAARELAGLVAAERLAAGAIYPSVAALRPVARAIAVALVRYLRDAGLGAQIPDDAVEAAVEAAMWWPRYPRLEPA